ncbi:hypothetical protein [Humisphaera borealis]|uniref:Uncharacterized protein n=1 Tax=Humisphaera borealis TaxID=2807512 RepID=A0A7M2WR08_9BACT|nr:hypothetical protein [Humisphaera borealis]QOV87938.1 hypothetical protein IPV69_16895 [Humisphaera borealis]
MLFQTTVKFLSALLGSLVAFYLASHFFHAAGFMTAYELQHVQWMYNQLLEPVTTLDWKTQKTALIALGAIGVQAVIVVALFRKWGYKPVRNIDPLARLARPTGGMIASGERLPTHEMSMYTGMDDADDIAEYTEAVDEEQRLLALLTQKRA